MQKLTLKQKLKLKFHRLLGIKNDLYWDLPESWQAALIDSEPDHDDILQVRMRVIGAVSKVLEYELASAEFAISGEMFAKLVYTLVFIDRPFLRMPCSISWDDASMSFSMSNDLHRILTIKVSAGPALASWKRVELPDAMRNFGHFEAMCDNPTPSDPLGVAEALDRIRKQ